MSRQTSNTSFGSSVGPGNRPPSRSHVRTRSNVRTPRPATSMGTRGENKTPSGQNGTMLPQPQFRIHRKKTSALPRKKVRKWNSVQDMSSTCEPLSPSREASFCNQFNSLSINETASQSQGVQATPQFNPPTPMSDVPAHSGSDHLSLNISVRSCSGESRSQEQALAEKPYGGQAAPKTPSRKELIHQFQRFGNSVRAALTPARGGCPSPAKVGGPG